MRTGDVWLVRGAILAVSIIGCSNNRGATVRSSASQSGEVACTATLGKLPAGTNISSIAGDYRFTLIASSGAKSGQRASGNLSLQRPANSTSTTTLEGSAVVSLDSVGASAPSMRSPGAFDITALQWSTTSGDVTTPEITVRFGTIAAPGTTRPIEGSHMALQLNTVNDDGFTGRWESGAGDTPMGGAAGHFCAERVK